MRIFDIELDKKRFTFAALIVASIIFITLRSFNSIDAKEILEFNRDPKNYNAKLQIFNKDDDKIAEFKIAIADDDHKKMYGFMNLDRLPQDQGMLFPFFTSRVITMWMKHTRIPLDMIFIDANDKIVSIKNDAEPYSLEVISSEKEAKKVLEINGGLARKMGIKIDQKVEISD